MHFSYFHIIEISSTILVSKDAHLLHVEHLSWVSTFVLILSNSSYMILVLLYKDEIILFYLVHILERFRHSSCNSLKIFYNSSYEDLSLLTFLSSLSDWCEVIYEKWVCSSFLEYEDELTSLSSHIIYYFFVLISFFPLKLFFFWGDG